MPQERNVSVRREDRHSSGFAAPCVISQNSRFSCFSPPDDKDTLSFPNVETFTLSLTEIGVNPAGPPIDVSFSTQLFGETAVRRRILGYPPFRGRCSRAFDDLSQVIGGNVLWFVGVSSILSSHRWPSSSCLPPDIQSGSQRT